MFMLRPTATFNTAQCYATRRTWHHASRMGRRTFRSAAQSKHADDVCCGASPEGESGAEVTNGLCLVVAGPVFHWRVCGRAGDGLDVPVGFATRTVRPSAASRQGRVVGRVLSARDRLAAGRSDASPRHFVPATCAIAAQIPPEGGLLIAPSFFCVAKHIVNNNAWPAQQRTALDSGPGTRLFPGLRNRCSQDRR